MDTKFACIVCFPCSTEFTFFASTLMNMRSSNLLATSCHFCTILVAFSSNVLATLNTVTVGGTRTSFIFQVTMTPKLAPPPPLMAQNRSSPMAFLSRRLPFTSIM
ncbi:hypothetical protein V8G54_000321 [Vigna mungo]|uniref:Uncharacterized protein n=1 Tax=Vigna mungo TaxID=3915 RepID=A0AAQ3P6P9_VIGMU